MKNDNDTVLANILIVDDIPSNIRLMVSILDEHGYSVSYAQSGMQAIELCKRVNFDLILLDVMMPVMDGFEVCEVLKGIESTKDVPIIFLTARTDQESTLKGFDAGGVDYVTKPFNEKELLVRIRTHLDLKQTRDALQSELEFKKKLMTENALFITRRTELGNAIIDELKQINKETQNSYRDSIFGAISKLKNLIQGQEWKEFELRFESEHTRFREILIKLHPDLTPNEVKLCTFLRLDMSSKEISEITNQSVRALETARSRMRKKLGLQRSDNLVQYLFDIA
ncbi:MAG: response regulator [Bacteroidales bacterium]|jgi:DNA-binding response OmpR family regulator|nr:response regulator [Bacteroidales bacterium]